MDEAKGDQILKILTKKFNPWWVGKRIPIESFRRSDFDYISPQLRKQNAITLIGPRQIGKTTLMRQIINELITAEGKDPSRILYADLGDAELRVASQNLIPDILEVYQKDVLHEELSSLSSEICLFFDEVQRDNDWAEALKSQIDSDHEKKIHILATGSSSLKITQKSKETLPGRSELQLMLPLKFVDAVRLRSYMKSQPQGSGNMFPVIISQENALDAEKLRKEGKALRAEFDTALSKGAFGDFYSSCKELSKAYISNEAELQKSLLDYITKGGYPAVIKTEDTAACQRLLTSYANDVIVKDLMPWHRIRDFDTAEKLLFLIAKLSGNILNRQSLNRQLPGANGATIAKYISFFEQLKLMSQIPIYSKSIEGSAKHPKVYFQDAGLRNALCGVLDAAFNSEEQGHLAETVVCDHLHRLSFKLNSNSAGQISCYRAKGSKDVEKEIDFIMLVPKHRVELPIEVKFRENSGGMELMRNFMQDRKQKLGVVITREELLLKEGILYIPLWIFLIMC